MGIQLAHDMPMGPYWCEHYLGCELSQKKQRSAMRGHASDTCDFRGYGWFALESDLPGHYS